MAVKNARKPRIELYALRGQFTDVTYFLTTMSLSECAEQLHFQNVDQVKSFNERVQRSLNKKRAELIFSHYLKKRGPRFFNSLVVVLMPKKGTTSGFYDFEPLKDENGDKLDGLGMLSVLTDIQRVVVDGQHRLHSLNAADAYTRESDYDENLQLKEARIPVAFLAFGKDIAPGFEKVTDPSKGDLNELTSKSARQVFVALNKNAKVVDKNSLLILDDQDFSAVATRSLIENDDRLEMFCKWHGSGSSLTDSDVFFTNIHTLDWFIEHETMCISQDDISKNYTLPIEAERTQAIEEHFDKPTSETALLGLSRREIVKKFFSDLAFFEEWRSKVTELLSGNPVLQPKEQELSTDQKRAIKKLRQANILATVAGQKATFEALMQTFPHMGKEEAKQNLDEALRRVNVLYEKGIMSRDHSIWMEFLVRPGTKMKLTAISPSARLLQCILEQRNDEYMKPFFESLIDDGVGTEKSLSAFQEIKTVVNF